MIEQRDGKPKKSMDQGRGQREQMKRDESKSQTGSKQLFGKKEAHNRKDDEEMESPYYLDLHLWEKNWKANQKGSSLQEKKKQRSDEKRKRKLGAALPRAEKRRVNARVWGGKTQLETLTM